MIDIIIPAYNAHDTIEQALHSIATQVNKNNLQVIIVNDGGEDYHNIVEKFSQWLNIKEVTCPHNCGPGYARNFGIENSNSKYIMFMDADDTLAYSYSLSLLSDAIEKNNANIIISKIAQINKDKEKNEFILTELEPNMTWLFGHLYKREFLNKYNIRFLSSCYNEDTGFNNLCLLFSFYENLEKGIICYDGCPATYEWRYRADSLSEKDCESLQHLQLRVLGYLYNSIKTFERVSEYPIPIEQCIDFIIIALFTIYQHGYLLYSSDLQTELTKDLEDLSRYFYHKCCHLILKRVPMENILFELQAFVNREFTSEELEKTKMNFEDFIDFMLSKPSITEIDENNIQLKLLPSKNKVV